MEETQQQQEQQEQPEQPTDAEKLTPPKMETRRNRHPSARMLAAKQDEEFLKAEAQPVREKSESRKRQATEESSTPLRVEDIIAATNTVERAINALVEEANVTLTEQEIEMSEKFEIEEKHAAQDLEIDVETIKSEIPPQIIVDNVGAEVTIEAHGRELKEPPIGPVPRRGRTSNYTGETLTLSNSDLSVPNKAAHFLYFRCYHVDEVQKEFPLTVDWTRKGPQNFLVEPREGLRNTDYYIDSYLWNRGKSTSSKKKIYVEVENNHVKTSRKALETAPYILNWYYSNMENRVTKKVCWLETCPDGTRASPVLVQYNVLYVVDTPLDVRRTPKLYSDTRTVAQEMLRNDSPLHTVARFMETGETDPREVVNKRQAYEMRRYVVGNKNRKLRQNRKEMIDMDGNTIFYDDPNGDVYEETVFFDDDGMQQTHRGERSTPLASRSVVMSEAGRIASNATEKIVRRLENRLSALLDQRLGLCPSKLAVLVPRLNNPDQQAMADQLADWINALSASTADDSDIVIHNVTDSMRKVLSEMLVNDGSTIEFMEESSSRPSNGEPRLKRQKQEEEDDQYEEAHHPNFVYGGTNMEYVEEVIAEEIEASEVAPNAVVEEEIENDESGEVHDGDTRYFYPDHPAPQATGSHIRHSSSSIN